MTEDNPKPIRPKRPPITPKDWEQAVEERTNLETEQGKRWTPEEKPGMPIKEGTKDLSR